MDELDQRLDRADEAARGAHLHHARRAVHEEAHQGTEQHRPEDGVDVDDREIDDVLLGRTRSVQVRQMVNDVFGRGGCVGACSHVGYRISVIGG